MNSALTTEKNEEKDNAGNFSNGKSSSGFSYGSKQHDEVLIEKNKYEEILGFRSDDSPKALLTNYYFDKNNLNNNSNLIENKDSNNNSPRNKKVIGATQSDFNDKKAKDITNEFFDFSIKGKINFVIKFLSIIIDFKF